MNDLFPSLITRRVITIVDKEKLCLGRVEQEVAQEFIEKHLFPQLATGDTENFYRFISAMKESEKCNFLVTKLMERITIYQKKSFSGL